MTTVGVFSEMAAGADWPWYTCDGPAGADSSGLRLAATDRAADWALCINFPVWPKGAGMLPWWKRRAARLAGRYEDLKTDTAFAWLGTPAERTLFLWYEPPAIARRYYAASVRHCRRVWAPDDAPHPGVTPATLPAWWTLRHDVHALRCLQPRDQAIALSAVTSGKSALAGHRDRLAFIRALRSSGVPMHLFGWELPADLSPGGVIGDKSALLAASRCTLAIENDPSSDRYVSEKFWDPLLSWSVPLYFGGRAPDTLVPPEAFIRLPDLGPAGLETVRAAVADPDVRTRRLDAIAQARRIALDRLRLPLWLADRLGELRPDATHAQRGPQPAARPAAERPALGPDLAQPSA
ncbi:MAG: hypothetical protein C0475_00390 [Planctomyces sp.]|nr:hypothetical protein [Planctomyces sp.]MBA4119178.1 hypothetical protein [Isosphaera sp.]